MRLRERWAQLLTNLFFIDMKYEVIKRDWTVLDAEPVVIFTGSHEDCMKILAEIRRDLHISPTVDYRKVSMVKDQHEYLLRKAK